MLILYASRTGNVKRFVDKLNMRTMNIVECSEINEPYVLIAFTTGFGEIPAEIEEFLNRGDNAKYLRGVASSGNRNWGSKFAKSADIISEKYNVPIILKFELSGVKGDVEKFKERVDAL